MTRALQRVRVGMGTGSLTDGARADKKLRGVGPATASAVLSAVQPDVFPFIRPALPFCHVAALRALCDCCCNSDELLESMASSIGPRVY